MSKCYVCESEQIKSLKREQEEYLECNNCGLLWRNPPVEDNLDYYSNINPTHEINSSKEDLYVKQLIKAERYLKKDLSVIDVGCSEGYYLELARKIGWRTIGVEPVPVLVETAQKKCLEVYSGKLKDLDESIKNINMITYWDVFMFVDNPLEEIAEAKRRLAEKGIIYVRVRNHKIVRSIDKLYKCLKNHINLRNPAVYHPFNYIPETLQYIAEELNLECLILNGMLTKGDPYKVSNKEKIIDLSKMLVQNGIKASERILGDRYYLSPTLDVWFRKKNR